jgi:hypothetical protein
MVLTSPASTSDDLTFHDRRYAAAVDELFALDES